MNEPEEEIKAQLFQELRSIEIEEGSVIFINVGRDTPISLCRRTRDTLNKLLESMGYERVGVFLMQGEISVNAIRPTDDRQEWLEFLKESLQELKEKGHGTTL